MEKVRYMISDAANRIQVESHVLALLGRGAGTECSQE